MATATYHGANYTVADNSPKVGSFLPADEWGGNVKAILDSFLATADDTGDAGSLIYVGKLPKGAVPLGGFVHSNGAITFTGTIGWSGDADALGDIAAFTGAGTQAIGPDYGTIMSKQTTARDVYITTATQAITSGDEITVVIFYIQGG